MDAFNTSLAPKYVTIDGKRVSAKPAAMARAARWEAIQVAWSARHVAHWADDAGQRAAARLLSSLLGGVSRVDQAEAKLAPRVVGGDQVAVAAVKLLSELREQLPES